MNSESKFAIGGIIVFLLIVALITLSPFTIISAGERGVVLRLGEVSKVLSEGIHWVTPLMDSVKKMDVMTKKEEVTASSASKDLQLVTTKVAVNYNLEADKVGDIYKNLRYNYVEVVIIPTIQESVKAATAKYTAEELITKREMVKQDMVTAMKERMAGSFITVTNVSITDFDFSAEFNKSIEAKVKAEQDAQTAKNKLEQVKFEAQQTIETAKAQAESIKIQAAAVTSQGGADYVKLQWIKAWESGGAKVPTFITSDNSSGFIYNIDKN